MRIALGLGSSLGDRRTRLELTIRQLAAHPRIRVERVSRWVRTPPLRGGTARGWFLNGVALLDVEMTPHELLTICRSLEEQAGRRRARHWGDRPLDLDLLVAEGCQFSDDELTVPHPALTRRAFVLAPLQEVWPDALSPENGIVVPQEAPEPLPRVVPVGVVARRPLSA